MGTTEKPPAALPLARYLRLAFGLALVGAACLSAVFVFRTAGGLAFRRDRELTEGLALGAARMLRPAAARGEGRSVVALAERASARHGFLPEDLAALGRAAGQAEASGEGGEWARAAAADILVLALLANDRLEGRYIGSMRDLSISSAAVSLLLACAYFALMLRFKRRFDAALPLVERQLEGLAAGEFGLPAIGGGDELGRLSSDVAAAGRRLESAMSALAEERDRNAAHVAERERLMRELVHRVRNNYAMIASLVDLQRREAGAGEAGRALADLGGRIRSIVLLHDRLESGIPDQSVDVRKLLGDLAKGIVDAMVEEPGLVDLRVGGDEARLDPRRAKTLGLIVNELAMNSLKHSLPAARAEGRPLALSVSFRAAEDRYELEVGDDGPGYAESVLAPAESSPAARRGGLGVELIRSFCADLGGSARFENRGGARFSTSFPAAPAG